MPFDQNTVDDWVYAKLNVVGVTASVPNARIVQSRIAPGTEPTYPTIVYQIWGKPRPTKTLGNGRATYHCAYKIVVWTKDDQRSAKTIAAAIETAMTTLPHAALTNGATVVICDVDNYIYDEDEKSGDTEIYIQAGAIYEIEVTA